MYCYRLLSVKVVRLNIPFLIPFHFPYLFSHIYFRGRTFPEHLFRFISSTYFVIYIFEAILIQNIYSV